MMQTTTDALVLSSDEMIGKGYPPLEIWADFRGSNLIVSPFPSSKCICQASGPPGSMLGFGMTWLEDECQLEEAVDKRLSGNPIATPGISGNVMIDGSLTPIITWTEQTGPWRTHIGAALIPIEDMGSVLVEFTVLEEDGKKSPSPRLENLLRTLRIEA